MSDLMERVDPARGHSTDSVALRRKADQKISGVDTRVVTPSRRPWTYVLAGFVALLLAVSVPVLLRQQSDDRLDPATDGPAALPGIELVVPLAAGGVQTGAVDGNTMWMMTALAGQLQKINAATGEVMASYSIDSHIEGVIAGANHLWLLSYSNGGEVLRIRSDDGRSRHDGECRRRAVVGYLVRRESVGQQ